jgi:hypothetical protein
MSTRALFAAIILFGLSDLAVAQVPGPPPPAEYQVVLRYRIHAGRTERLKQYFALLEYLERVGFQKDPGDDGEPEDTTHNQMTGKIASANARRLLDNPHIKTLLLLPPGFKLPTPEEADAPVKVRIDLVGGFPPHQQRLLSEQTKELLRELGFQEATAYDHRGYTRLVGTIRAGELETLVKDLRGQPAGWLFPIRPISDLPLPLRETSPLRVVEVIPEPEGVAALKELPPVPEVPAEERHLQKITPELRALLGNNEEAAKPRRLEVILSATPSGESTTWLKSLLEISATLVIEGRLGPIVTVLSAANKAPELAASPLVSTVRLPRSGAPAPMPGVAAKDRNREVLAASGVARFHAAGQKGKGVRVAVISGDFRGWETAVKNKQLPATTRVVDLTRQRNSNLEPDAYPDDGEMQGQGTQAAQALALAAPEADLVLLRVDPAAPYMLLTIARHINGQAQDSPTIDQRRDELAAIFDDLQIRWKELLDERRTILNNFNADEETAKKREAHFKKAQEMKDEEKAYYARMGRYEQQLRDLRNLASLNVVVNTLSWSDGHAVDGSSPLTQYLNNNPFRSTYWFQPAGDTRGQVWTGLFHDTDGNGIMEFTAPGAALPKDRWTSELNFLGWRKYNGQQEAELPGKATLRFTVQWRETHDPLYLNRGEDLYREPLAKFRLQLLRQRDPSYKKLTADDLELVARAVGLPQRLENQPGYATYEQLLEFNVAEPGNYALRVEGNYPPDIKPPEVPNVPMNRRQFELRLRVFVEVIDGESRGLGRPIFLDFITQEGAITMPGDSRSLFTVGALGLQNRMQPFSAYGPPFNLALLVKPTLLSYDSLEVSLLEPKGVPGTSIAASYAAGLAATSLGAGYAPGVILSPPSGLPTMPVRIPENCRVPPAGAK